jgi:integrase
MPKLNDRIPAYRLHKQSGQGIVTIAGRDHLLGKHDTAASRTEYNRLVAQWLASGRSAPKADSLLTVNEMIAAFRKHAERYYGNVREPENFANALRPLRTLYGDTTAAEFGPLKLKAVRETVISADRLKATKAGERAWSRTYCNRQIDRMKHVFKWATENELIPPSVYHGLATVAGLSFGRTDAAETEPVKPVPDQTVDATIPRLSTVVAAMVRVQRLTGARPAEICMMKIGEIDRSTQVWAYTPPLHKTRRHGQTRTIFIGPKAQAVLAPFLMKMNPTAHVFTPAAAIEEMRQRRAEARKTPMSCGNRPGSNRKRRPARLIGQSYDVAAYRRAIARACDDAFPPPANMIDPKEIKQWRSDHRWHPHQLRHSAATQIRAAFGVEAAQHTLGHAGIDVTLLYAEKTGDIAKRVAASIG